MLHVLRGGDEPRVEDVLGRLVADQILAFLDQPFHTDALLSAGARVESLADALESLDVLLRLLFVLHEGALELWMRGGLRHARKCLEQLRLGAPQVLELFDVEFVQGFHFHRSVLRVVVPSEYRVRWSQRARGLTRMHAVKGKRCASANGARVFSCDHFAECARAIDSTPCSDFSCCVTARPR